MRNYVSDREWADKYYPQIRDILNVVFGTLIDISPSTQEEDNKRAIDYKVINMDKVSVGCRLRKGTNYFYKYNDVTFRMSRPNGYKTELSKIREGFPDWYLYCWVNSFDFLSHWVIIDMAEFRKPETIDNPDTVSTNKDGTKFAGFKLQSLMERNVVRYYSRLVAEHFEIK